MMQLKRSAVAMLSAAALGLAGLAATTAPAQAATTRDATVSAGAPSAAPTLARTKYWLNFKYSSWTHKTPDPYTSTHAGHLNAGINYVFCYTNGVSYTDKGHTSTVWLQTNDDEGFVNVYVSRVYLDDSSYNADLPHC
ncbi:hypothetical protein ABZ990_13895 [Streptomyces sp. NPDC046203]|uniref:hypothetical protein n=1 Tax=Streptomyces sp. NPDC046203 TaxID=3154602 RepID=UPI0033C7F5B6